MTPLSIHSLHTRLLYPFFFDANQLAEVIARLQNTKTPREKSIWEPVENDCIPEFYRQEMLTTVGRFVFDTQKKSYWRVHADTLNQWFGNHLEVNYKEERFEVTSSGTEGIELFLSDYGVGILSIKLIIKHPNMPDNLKQVNYRLSQGGRPATTATLALPYQANPNAPLPPIREAPLVERLGKRGGQFTLPELTDYLLSAFKVAELSLLHQKFKVFTVVRLNQSSDELEDFLNTAVVNDWQPMLFGLAHVEEIAHVGTLSAQHQRLNPNHWAAVTSSACAHLLIDQYHPPQNFDEQRVPTVLYKYFVHYLIALLQDSILQGFLDKAAKIAQDAENQTDAIWEKQLQTIHLQHLRFSASGYFIETSVREANNQFYRLAQQGLRVPETFTLTQRVLHDIEVSGNLRQQHQFEEEIKQVVVQLDRNVSTVTNIQRKVEWLEVFFASYYACALAYYIAYSAKFTGEVLGELSYQAVSVVVWPMVAGLLVFFGAKPHEHTLSTSPEKFKLSQWMVTILAIILPVIWFMVGITWFKGNGGH